MNIIPRSQWGARPPRQIQNVGWDKRTGFTVHHSGANPHQSVREIQNFHMDTRGWSDIGYNFLINPAGEIFEGRGWNRVGAHAVGYNTATIGVCIIGDYNASLPPSAALDACRWMYQEATRLKGSHLALFGHRDIGQTDCPGNALWAFVHRDLGVLPTGPANGGSGEHRPGSRELYLADPHQLGDDVAFVQRFIGPPCGRPDGDYGPKTASGVAWYQHMRGIASDGRCGPRTWAQMGVRWTS